VVSDATFRPAVPPLNLRRSDRGRASADHA
jgi:hypothetical protein